MKTFTSFSAVSAELERQERESFAQEQAEKEARYDAFKAKYNAAFMPTATRCELFNMVQNALEEAFDAYAETDAYGEEDLSFSGKFGPFNISITEEENGFEVTINHKSVIIDALVVTNQLVRYFIG